MNDDNVTDLNDFKRMEAKAAQLDAGIEAENNFSEAIEPAASINAAFKPVILKALGFVAGLANSQIPLVTAVFNKQANENIADAMVNVANIEGIDLQALFGDPNSRMGAWVALAIAVGLPSFSLYMAVLEYKKRPPQKATDAELSNG